MMQTETTTDKSGHTCCCPTGRTAVPVNEQSYKGKGKMVPIPIEGEIIDCYVVGEGEHVVFLGYDVFGLHPNKLQLADKFVSDLGKLTFIIPDFFKDKAWPAEKYPPKSPEFKEEFAEFLGKVANWTLLAPKVEQVFRHYQKTKGCSAFSVIGLCWGAKLAVASYPFANLKSIVGVHPSFLNADDAKDPKVPTLLLPTGDDNLEDYESGLATDNHLITIDNQFNDMFHGFLGARGHWEDPHQKSRAWEAMQVIQTFLKKTLFV